MSGAHVVCCVDSSDERSDLVFNAASNLVSQCHSAHMTVFSAHRTIGPDSPRLPADREPRTIALHFESKCISRFSKSRFEVVTAELPSTSPIREGLMDVVTALNGDIVVLGYTGRKGPKEDASIMGSSTDLSLRNGNMTALIVKNGGPYPVVAVAFDGSARSMNALKTVVHLVADANEIIAIFVKSAGACEDISAQATVLAQRELATLAASASPGKKIPTFKVICVDNADMNTITNVFIRAADDVGASLLVTAPRDLSTATTQIANDFKLARLGSFSEALVRYGKVDILLIYPKNGSVHGLSSRRAGD